MARPKKARFFQGVQLADNLYPDPCKRDHYWRYIRPDGSSKTFQANSVELANKIAGHNNEQRIEHIKLKEYAKQGILKAYIPQYIDYRERQSPDLKAKDSWKNYCYMLHQLGREIQKPVRFLDRDDIQIWWDTLSYHQQKSRHAEFRRFFNYLMGRKLLPKMVYNPFTTADDKPRLYCKSKPKRKSQRLTREGFWRIFRSASILHYPCLQVAMGISLTTFMREGDICDLRLTDNIEGDLLKRVIGKSENTKGSAKAARLSWDIGNYRLLQQLIKAAREMSLQNRRCPFVINHWPLQKRLGKRKEHLAQVLPRRLIDMFAEARKHAGFTGPNPPTFHSIRSLADKLAADAGYDLKIIQHAMAHTDEATTLLYQDDHDSLPFDRVNIEFTEEQIGGDFSGIRVFV